MANLNTNIDDYNLEDLFKILGLNDKSSEDEVKEKTGEIIQKMTYENNSTPDRGLSLLLIFIFAYSGMASLSSEILWTRVLVFPMGTTLSSFALILSIFLFGIALGSIMAEKLLGNSNHVIKFLLIQQYLTNSE